MPATDMPFAAGFITIEILRWKPIEAPRSEYKAWRKPHEFGGRHDATQRILAREGRAMTINPCAQINFARDPT